MSWFRENPEAKMRMLNRELQKTEDDVGTPGMAERMGEPICEGQPFDEHAAYRAQEKPLRPGLRTLLFLLIDCLVIALICRLFGFF